MPWVDLLRPETYWRYLQTPELLLVVVRWLIEHRGVDFALCGSSARKVRRGQDKLLEGHGERRQLHGVSAMGVGSGMDLVRLLNHGYLSPIHDTDRPLPCLTPTSPST